jgi:hypothetical protein
MLTAESAAGSGAGHPGFFLLPAGRADRLDR